MLATLESKCGEDFCICFAACEYFGIVWLLPVLTQCEFQDARAGIPPLSSGPCFSRVSRPMPVSNSVSFHLFKLYSAAEHSRARKPQPDSEHAPLPPYAHAAPAAQVAISNLARTNIYNIYI